MPKTMWTCPYCDLVFHKGHAKASLASRRRDHLKKAHAKDRGKLNDHMREYTPVVVAVDSLPQ